jgi:hypothetical protein
MQTVLPGNINKKHKLQFLKHLITERDMKKLIIIFSLLLFTIRLYAQWSDNSDWTFVGPYSDNLLNYNPNTDCNKFQTGQLNIIAVDPTNEDHLITGGPHGGLWITTTAGNGWDNIGTIPIGSNGVSAAAFKNSNEIYAGNYFDVSGALFYSNGVYKYTINTDSWTQLGSIPNSGHTFIINKIVFYPSSTDIVFLCTTMGLFKSTNAGSTWTFISDTQDNNISNMVFLPKPSPSTDYYCIISGTYSTALGSTTDYDAMQWKGRALIKKSTNTGSNFSTIGEFDSMINTDFSSSTYTYMNSYVCTGDLSDVNDRDIYIYTAMGSDYKFSGSYNGYSIQKINFDDLTVDNYTELLNSPYYYSDGASHPSRLTIIYDSDNNALWYGGVHFYDISLNTLSVHPHAHFSARDLDGKVHDDIHELAIADDSLYIASDGGLYYCDLTGYTSGGANNIFYTKNNDLNVSWINGFSGASGDPDFYLFGYQDIIYTDFYDADLQESEYSPKTGENDGGIIDKFDNDIVIADHSSYDAEYFVSTSNPIDINNNHLYYNQYYGTGFGLNTYFQDPYRSNRIYYGLMGIAVSEYDFTNNYFINNSYAYKFRLGLCFNSYGNLYRWQTSGMAFSKQDANSVHLISTSHNDPSVNHGSFVIKYIGDDFDGMYQDFNECEDGNSQPQWQDISPDWYNKTNFDVPANYTALSTPEVQSFEYNSIVKSPLNNDVVYVSCGLDKDLTGIEPSEIIPQNPDIKVLKYDGSEWSNYSDGIPSDAVPSTMVIDINSNDNLYLATDKGIYYRDPSMDENEWESYSTGMPIMFATQLEINYFDKTVRASTQGRGLWKSPLHCPDNAYENETVTYTADEIVEANVIESTSTINSGLDIIYKGGTSITLNPGFKANEGSHFYAFIQPCEGLDNNFRTISKNDIPEIRSVLPLKENKFTVMPNPNNGNMTVRYEIPETETGTFEVYDFLGKKLLSYSLVGGNNTLSISHEELLQGVYFYRAFAGSKQITSDKIVVIK